MSLISLSFRIRMIRIDNGYEFQTMFNRHADELCLIHAYIRPASPYFNGKVELSHLRQTRVLSVVRLQR